MAVHIEKLTSDVSVQAGDLSLSPAQIDKLVALVISRLEDRAREAQRARAATKLTRHASRPFEAGD
jgi:hypothetical protein